MNIHLVIACFTCALLFLDLQWVQFTRLKNLDGFPVHYQAYNNATIMSLNVYTNLWKSEMLWSFIDVGVASSVWKTA